ncbi:MAG: NAD+ synthase [Deltaproteobacteria bacterium]|jgi:NAD+ synthetase|nr:NAD+ synthase [Deltaproteobacteria bacterium]
MKIALVQINPVIGDFAHNCAKILAMAERAREKGCGLAVFPELALCGYPPQDLLERPAFLEAHDRALQRLVSEVAGIGIICGHLEKHTDRTGKPLHNSASLIAEGKIIFTARKRLLPTYDVFDEARYFEPGGRSETCRYKGLTLGITVCEDIWNDKGSFPQQLYASDPVHDLVARQQEGGSPLDLLVNISASPFQVDKEAVKQKIFTRVCTSNNIPLLYVNQVGGQDSLLFDGWSMAMDARGRIVSRAERFDEDMVVVDTADLDRDGGGVPETFPGEETGERPEAATILEALVMGVKDYGAKCGFSRGVVGLSGGIDSAVTCAVACEAFGPENVLGVSMPSPYTSAASVEDARQLAANLRCRFETIGISPVLDALKESLAPVFPVPAAGSAGKVPVTEQNMQARIRGNLLMALSNQFGFLLLSTGNKSETAVGYCTLYGDMSGGLAVISDVPKLLVYELAAYINREREVIPVRIIEKPPSAELAPEQRDQDDLPPYEILDPILKAYLEENRSVAEIAAMGFDRKIVADVVRRIRINEYKRKQAPPGLKITSKAFGYGRRYPTAQNFREEDASEQR